MPRFFPASTKGKVLAAGAGVAAIALAGGGWFAWQITHPTPEMVMKALGDQRAKLLAMCPPAPPRVAASEEAKLPMKVDHWGTEGPRVLLIHGGVQGRVGGGPATFERQRDLVKMGWAVDTVWRPGFGESPTRGKDDMAADARGLAELITPGTNIIAHSWGGTEAILAAAMHPENVASLIIIEPAIVPTIGGKDVLNDPAVMADLKERTIAQLAVKTPGDYTRFFGAHMGKMDPNDRLLGPEMTDEVANQAGCSGLYAVMASDKEVQTALEVIRRAGIPVLLITGGWSPQVDATGGAVAKLAGGTHVIVKAPNHFLMYANPTEFNRVVSDFMKQAQARKE